jgi:hypothetical protein
MDNKIFEELPARNIRPAASPIGAKKPAAAQSNTSMGDFREKASQLASDVRYKAEKNKITVQQEWQNEMRNSQAPMQVKMLAKRMLFGKGISEEYGVDTSVTNTVANALYKVFVEGLDEVQEDSQISEDMDAIKYEVRVTYKDTGKTEIHLWTRELINKKRENPNIQHIEMVGRPIVRKKRGSSLDPYNKSTGSAGDGDINNNRVPDTDRKKDPQGNYLLNRRKKIGSAIQSNNEQFDMLEAKSKNTKLKSKTDREIGVMSKNERNNVTVFPDSKVHEETGYSKFLSMVNEKTSISVEEGAKVDRTVKHIEDSEIAAGKNPKKAKNIAWATANKQGMLDNKNKKKVAEAVGCEYEYDYKTGKNKDKKVESDPRSIPTTTSLIKNKLRAIGMKNPIVMVTAEETEVIDERRREDKGTPRPARDPAIEILRSKPMFQGLMTRSGKTLTQHKNARGVKKDRTSEVNPEPPANPPAKKLAAKKAGVERQREIGREMQSSRFD